MAIPAFIFARGGSKGLPNKNILDFCGKPLIAWSIEQALNVTEISQVIVSTDSEEIAMIAKDFGAEIPFLRPSELAADDSSEILSWQHALNFMKLTTGSYPEVFVSIPTTSPLRQSTDIENCLEEFRKSMADVLVTVTKAHKNPYFNMVSIDSAGLCKKVIEPKEPVSRRQDASLVYDMTAVCYVARPQYVLESESIFDGKVLAFEIPAERAIDIDTLLDFEFAEFIKGQR